MAFHCLKSFSVWDLSRGNITTVITHLQGTGLYGKSAHFNVKCLTYDYLGLRETDLKKFDLLIMLDEAHLDGVYLSSSHR